MLPTDTQRQVPKAPHIARLDRSLRWLTALCLVVAAAGAAKFSANPVPAALASAAVPLLLGLCLFGASAVLRRGRVEAGLSMVALAIYLGATAYSLATPGSVLAIPLLPVLVVALGLPYLSGPALRRFAVLAWLGGMAVLALNVFQPASALLPPMWFRYLAFGAVAGFILLALSHYSARLQESLAEARRAQEALRRVDAQKTRFLQATAHELRNPMTPVLAQLHLLREGSFGPLNDRQFKAMSVIDRNLLRLNGLVEDVLDVARLQGGSLRLRRERVDLRAALAEAAESFRAAAAQADLAMEVEAPEGLVVDADPRRVAQVLDNLLGNALKFTPAGGRVVLRAEAEGQAAVVRVADTGAGVAADEVALLFQPFSQLAAAEGKPGAGLGLYVSRGILEAHGGRIWCESQGLGQGATFAFRLPLAAAAAMPRAAEVTPRGRAGSPRVPASR